TAIARIQDAGAVRLGALHMAEFAYGPTGHNEHLGPARNPWDPQRITGGSSSGSAASVAARLTYAALGSDTRGSIRLPAPFLGCHWVQANLWSRQPCQRDAAVVHAGYGRSISIERGGLRADRVCHCGRRSARPHHERRARLGHGGDTTHPKGDDHWGAAQVLC